MAMERRMNLENIRRRELDIEEEQDGGTEMGIEHYSDANMSDASVERGSKVIAGTWLMMWFSVLLCINECDDINI